MKARDFLAKWSGGERFKFIKRLFRRRAPRIATPPAVAEKSIKASAPPLNTLIVCGNCQAGAIAHILKKTRAVQPLFRVIFYNNFETPGKANASIQSEQLTNCRIFLRQSLPAPFPFLDQLPNYCLKMEFRSLDFHLLWPFGCANPYHKPGQQAPSETFPYGDRIILDCVNKGMKSDEILDYYLNGWQQYRVNLQRLIDVERSRQAERDSHCEVKMGGWMMENFRRKRLHWTVNHPSTIAVRELIQRLLDAAAGLEPALEEAKIDQTLRVHFPSPRRPLGIVVVPIHPRVAEALELEWYEPNALHPFFERTYSYEQYFRDLIEYCIKQRAAAMSEIFG